MLYQLIKEPYSYELDVTGNKDFLGISQNKKCIFCGKTENEVSFKKVAHVIPAALGNRVLFNHEECDVCNEQFFSKHENELVNFLMLDRVFVRARKRNGSPKYKPSGGESYIEGKVGTNQVRLNLLDGEDSFEIIETDGGNTIIMKLNDPPPYRPEDICKSLTHMAWPLLPESFRTKLTYVPEWLLNKLQILPLFCDVAFVPGNGYAKVILELWKSVDEQSDYPIAIRFTFGFKIITFYLPTTSTVKTKPSMHLDYIQHPGGIDITVDAMMINDDQRIKPKDVSYTFSFKSRDEKRKLE
ncbi:HNH endonuclease [Priestia sp. BR_2]